jgi:hypothetical protein
MHPLPASRLGVSVSRQLAQTGEKTAQIDGAAVENDLGR